MPRSELVQVRAQDLEPGVRVRLPRQRELVCVTSVSEDDLGSCLVHTEAGTYVCDPNDLIDAEDCGEVRI